MEPPTIPARFSLVAAEYLARFDGIVSARDSLANAVEGDVRLSTVTSTVLRAFDQLNLPAPVTWTELVSSGSLSVIRDAQLRGTLAEYYVTMRPRLELQLSRSDRRGRDPFTDALYPMGFFLPCVPDVPCAEGGADSDGQQDLASSFKELDPAAFTGWPGIADLLTGLGSHHGRQGVFARRLLSDASATLRRIEAIRPQERIQPN
jgi:hypothetical protein